MQRLTHLSLFSGIGGLELAAEMAGFRTVGQCEWADYPTKVLEKHWPDVPRWRDIRTLTKESFYEKTGMRTVDVISGGFPCQPFSVAGKRRGKEDDRYLWPEMLRVIEDIRPAWVVGENVAGIVSMALDQVLSDLEAAGYEARAVIIPACSVDAPHRRDRCAIVAYCDKVRRNLWRSAREGILWQEQARRGQVMADAAGKRCGEAWGDISRSQEWLAWCSENVADTKCQRQREDGNQSSLDQKRDNPAYRQKREAELCKAGSGGGNVSDTENRQTGGTGYRDAEPGLGRVDDGFPGWLDRGMSAPGYWLPEPDISRLTTKREHRKDRLQCLGNAVVPQQFYPVFRAIAESERLEALYD